MLALQRTSVNNNILRKKLTVMAKRSQPSSDMAAFREVLSKAKHIAILSGAGTSAESGIPTFRGAGGFWRTYQAQDLASPRAFAGNPSLVWEFYHYRRELVLTKQPNQAHLAVAKYEKHMKENGKKLSLITQNIDGLHQRAGSENVIELHGSLFKTQCTKCDEVLVNRDSPICPALRGKGAPDPNAQDARIHTADLPQCHCGGLLRPHVVWFGESLDPLVLQQAEDALENCDLCLVIGTSSVVYPAAMFAPQVAQRGVPVAEFNIEKTPATFNFHISIAAVGDWRNAKMWISKHLLSVNSKRILRRIASQADKIRIQPVPKNCFSQVLDHVTKVFLENESLVNTFPPCLTGARERDFRKSTEKVLQEKFSIMALDGPNVVGCSLNSQLTRENVFSYVETAKNLYEDQAVNHIAILCIVVHKELDLFTKLNVDKMFEIDFLTVEPSHAGKGLATKLVQSSLELGAQRHFDLAKADCTGPASAAACKKAGMEEVHKLFYDDYKIDNRVVFRSTPNRSSHLTVVACRLQNCRPYVLPVFSTE